MYVDKPVFKETLREWRAFGIRVDPNICRNILNLPRKDGKSIKMQDRYICKERCDINIKITDDDLKVKKIFMTRRTCRSGTVDYRSLQFSYFSCYIRKHN